MIPSDVHVGSRYNTVGIFDKNLLEHCDSSTIIKYVTLEVVIGICSNCSDSVVFCVVHFTTIKVCLGTSNYISPATFIEVHVPSQISERSCMCVLGESILPLSAILIFEVWNCSISVVFWLLSILITLGVAIFL